MVSRFQLQVDEEWLEGFKDYLLKDAVKSSKEKLSQNSASHYFIRVKYCLKLACNEKLIADNPAESVKYIKLEETHREFLTVAEIRKLEKKSAAALY